MPTPISTAEFERRGYFRRRINAFVVLLTALTSSMGAAVVAVMHHRPSGTTDGSVSLPVFAGVSSFLSHRDAVALDGRFPRLCHMLLQPKR